MNRIDALITIAVVKLAMEVHDWALHVGDFEWTPDAPWGTMYGEGGILEFLTYTEHWSLFWGVAIVLSLLTLGLLIAERREQ